jgi:hypothetical protein
MKRSLHATAPFSLVEITLALGVAVFCLIIIFRFLPVAEIGFQPTHGALVDANNKNIVAIQVMGVGGNN